jgi:glutathione S-transferase
MPDLILHHYPLSPFSEKIRAMLGYAGLSWQSVTTREMPPRPLVEALAGGYRKIPVAQIGADIFCDSKSIAREIAILSGKPELALENCTAEAQAWATRVDLTIFFACLMVGGTGKLGRKVLRSMSLLDIGRFFWDRVQIGRTASVRSPGPKASKSIVQAHLADMENRLQSQSFLFGDSPCHADFSAYHSLWFVRDLGESTAIDRCPKVLAWMDRIKGFGHGSAVEITGEAALKIAADSQLRAIPAEQQQDALIGRTVRIAPADYAQTETRGTLMAASAHGWTLARDQVGVGTLHIHFPRQGFSLSEV